MRGMVAATGQVVPEELLVESEVWLLKVVEVECWMLMLEAGIVVVVVETTVERSGIRREIVGRFAVAELLGCRPEAEESCTDDLEIFFKA